MGLTLQLKGWGAPRVPPKELYSTTRFTRGWSRVDTRGPRALTKGVGSTLGAPKVLYSTMRFTRVQAVGYQHRKLSGVPGASSVCCVSGPVPRVTQGCHTTPMYSVGMSEDL